MSNPEQNQGGERSVHDWMLDAVRTPVPLYDTAVESNFYGFTYGRFQLGDTVLQLLLDTSEFRARAMSYRGFKVAAGAWCVTGQRHGRVLGYNVKVDDTDTVNIHAEDLVTEKAREAGFRHISVLSIIGPTQEDNTSGKEMETLHPCGRCRERLNRSELVSDDTLVVTARPDFRVIQIANISALTVAHDQGDMSGITTFQYVATPQILKPRNHDAWQTNTPIRVEEIDSTDYDTSVGSFLLHRAFAER